MRDVDDPWHIDIEKMNLQDFVLANGQPIDLSMPFSVDEHFHSGIYCYGPALKEHVCGELRLAVDMQRGLLVEIDRLTAAQSSCDLIGDLPVMKDLAMVSSLRHPFLPETVATGVADDIPFVVRPFRLGRFLDEIISQNRLPYSVACGVAYSVAKLIQFLEQQSPFPNAYTFGDLGSEDIYLGYDGSIRVLGLGYKSLKTIGKKKSLSNLWCLAKVLGQLKIDPADASFSKPEKPDSLSIFLREMRQSCSKDCAERQTNVAQMFRTSFVQEIQHDRSFYGLQTLQ